MQLTREQYAECSRIFTALGEEGLYLNHYQLSEATELDDPITWKYFLTDPKTVDYITTEMNLIRTAAINAIIQKAPNSNSVGQAQLINALGKLDEKAMKKEGPVFIYSYVPLNSEQKEAPNIRKVNKYGLADLEEEGWISNGEFTPANLPD